MRIKTNANSLAKKLAKWTTKLNGILMREAMHTALEKVASVSIKDFWIQTSGVSEALSKPVHSKLLTQRTGRLISSIAGATRFVQTRLPRNIQEKKAGYLIVTKKFKKGSNESIRRVTVKGSAVEGIIGSKVPYSSAHEHGNQTTGAKARPFLRPARDASKVEILQIFKGIVQGAWDMNMKDAMS
mgnify:FL=1